MKAILKRSAIRLMSLPPMFGMMNRALNRAPVIFTLHRRASPEHGIIGHQPATLRKQLEFVLNNGYRAVTMDVIDAWVNGAGMDMTNTVAFTFDDGYRDQGELIRDVFVPLGVPASVFLITGFIDGKLWPWDTRIKWLVYHAPRRSGEIVIPSIGLRSRLSPDSVARRRLAHRVIRVVEPHPPERVETAIRELSAALGMEVPPSPPEVHAALSWHEARELEKSGVRFGSHSQDHYIFSGLNQTEAEQQIRSARRRLESELISPLNTFAYPIGNRWNFSGQELKILRETGYTSAVTMTPGEVQQPRQGQPWQRFVINRYGMPEEMEGFAQSVSWIERMKDRARAASPRRLIRQRYGSLGAGLEALQIRGSYLLGKLDATADVEWSRVKRVVFICMGNVCRSPFAEAVARQLGLPSLSLGLTTDQGTRVNPIASRVALEMGIDMTEHTSRLFAPSLLRNGDLLIGMEPGHINAVKTMRSELDAQSTLLGLHLPGSKVPFIADPYGASDAYHRRCFGIIRAAVETIAAEWSPRHKVRSRLKPPTQAPRTGQTSGPADR